jgi:eukaryotic-like serine/threonine-protein kinase
MSASRPSADSTVSVPPPQRNSGDELSPRGPPVPPRVALVAGSIGRPAGDLPDQLRKRLRFSAALVAVFCGLQTAITLPFDLAQLSADSPMAFARLPWHSVVLLIGCLEVTLAVWLSPHRPFSVERLRMIEWLIVTPVLTYSAWAETYELAPSLDQAGTYPGIGFTHWTLLIVGYGVVIPNTWYRCATMVALIALIAFIPDVLVIAHYGVLGQPAFKYLALKTLWLGVAGAIVVYGAYRIEVLRKEVAEARKLGQYMLKERIGVGGMGEVYLAEHLLLRRPCAIKLIRPERAGDAIELLRFEREVRTTATLTHPNTVQIFDYGHADDGTFYYVMEYLPGLTLSQLVKEHGSLPAARAVHFLRQVCGALREAHAVGLIHRDIKPSNVVVCQRGGLWDVAKLLDFGLVLPRADSRDGERLTQDGSNPGTPAYMSPEQASGRDDLDARSDIYGVGCLAYFLLTGQPPFAARSAARILAAHIYEPPLPFAGHCSGVPAELEAIVLRCLAKEPVERYASAESLDRALAGCSSAGRWSDEQAAEWWRDHVSVHGSKLDAQGPSNRMPVTDFTL